MITLALFAPLLDTSPCSLGMRDQRLPVPMSDFVARREMADIGTSLRALTSTQLLLVSAPAEQLTRCLVDY